jgi:CBS domain-containing protein
MALAASGRTLDNGQEAIMETTREDRIALGTVGDAMTATVLTLTPNEPLGSAARKLERAGVSGAPVVQDGRVAGVVTLRDILRSETGAGGPVATTGPWLRHERDLDQSGRVVDDVMSWRAVTVRATDPIVDAARRMSAARVNRVPVVDEDDRLVGILTRDDVVAAVARAGAVS